MPLDNMQASQHQQHHQHHQHLPQQQQQQLPHHHAHHPAHQHSQQQHHQQAPFLANKSHAYSTSMLANEAYMTGMSSDSELASSSTRLHNRPHSSQSRVYHAHPLPRPAHNLSSRVSHYSDSAASYMLATAGASKSKPPLPPTQSLATSAMSIDDTHHRAYQQQQQYLTHQTSITSSGSGASMTSSVPISAAGYFSQEPMMLQHQQDQANSRLVQVGHSPARRQLPPRPFKQSMSIDHHTMDQYQHLAQHPMSPHQAAEGAHGQDLTSLMYQTQAQSQGHQHQVDQVQESAEQRFHPRHLNIRREMKLVERQTAQMGLYGDQDPRSRCLQEATKTKQTAQQPQQQQVYGQQAQQPEAWAPAPSPSFTQGAISGTPSTPFKQTISVDHYQQHQHQPHYSPSRAVLNDHYRSSLGYINTPNSAASTPAGSYGDPPSLFRGPSAYQHQGTTNADLHVDQLVHHQSQMPAPYPGQQGTSAASAAEYAYQPFGLAGATPNRQVQINSAQTGQLRHQISSSSNSNSNSSSRNGSLRSSNLDLVNKPPPPSAAIEQHHRASSLSQLQLQNIQYPIEAGHQQLQYQQHHHQGHIHQAQMASAAHGHQLRKGYTTALGSGLDGSGLDQANQNQAIAATSNPKPSHTTNATTPNAGASTANNHSGSSSATTTTTTTTGSSTSRRAHIRTSSPMAYEATSAMGQAGSVRSSLASGYQPGLVGLDGPASSRSECSSANQANNPNSNNLPNSVSSSSSLAKKSNSTTQLSMTGTKKRLGFRKKQVTSFSVHRSEEVAPLEARHLVKQNSSVSEGDSSMSGDSSSRSWSNSNFKQATPDDMASMSFIEGLGRGQMVTRQGLASPYLGDIQLSLCDRRGNLEVEVIRARSLHAKGNKIPLTYVKLYLVKNRKCLAKAKTTLSNKRTLDPLFQQQLTFHEDYHGCVLQSIIWGNFGSFDKKVNMGIAQISIDDLELSDTVISWYKLFLPSSLQSLPSKSLRHTLLSNSTESFTNSNNTSQNTQNTPS